MVIVIVADENAIDRRRIVEPYSRIAMPPRSEEWDRAHPIGPDWIAENIETASLQKKGRVIHKGNDKVVAKNALYGLWAVHRFDEIRQYPILRREIHLTNWRKLWRGAPGL